MRQVQPSELYRNRELYLGRRMCGGAVWRNTPVCGVITNIIDDEMYGVCVYLQSEGRDFKWAKAPFYLARSFDPVSSDTHPLPSGKSKKTTKERLRRVLLPKSR